MSSNAYIECGKIINTHGCYGGIKLESWCNSPEELAMLKKLYIKKDGEFIKCNVEKASVFKHFVIVTLNNVKSMDEALALKNTVVYALRKDFHLEDGEYFIADLSGLNVIDADNGKVYGTLLEVINRGASDIYVVKTFDGERMIPAVPEFVKSIDIKKGIYVTPISGMLD